MVRFGCGGPNGADPEVINGALRKAVRIHNVRSRVGGEPDHSIGPDNSSHLKRGHVALPDMYAVYCGASRTGGQERVDSVIDQEQCPVADSICSAHDKIVKVCVAGRFVPNLDQSDTPCDRCPHSIHDAELTTQHGVRDKIHTAGESRATRHAILTRDWISAASIAANASMKAMANVPGPCAFTAANSAAIV